MILSNAEVADQLASFAQLLSTQPDKNPYKVRAYQRAAARIRTLPESVPELVRDDADLTVYTGIGDAIATAVREIVLTGSLGRLEKLRSEASRELAGLTAYPRLDPKRVLRVYKKLGVSTMEALRESLESGEIELQFGSRMAQHIRQGITESSQMLLYRADEQRTAVEEFLMNAGGVRQVEVAGDYRRRVEVVDDLAFLVDADDFPALVRKVQGYGGKALLLRGGQNSAALTLPSGIELNLQLAKPRHWGLCLVQYTGSRGHLRKLTGVTGSLNLLRSSGQSFPTEAAFYESFGLQYVEPELREGYDEIQLAKQGALPQLVSARDIRGELHAHSLSSDGSHSIEQMAAAARDRGYEYIGISDHSQSLKIAGGVSVEDLWEQIRYIDRLNEKMNGVRILKSSEVDILQDGSLDYPDDLLKELDYTVCSIHSRFALGKQEQTERILRAMNNRYFNILGHATGRLLLKRPGYEIDVDRVVTHAKENGCFFEINSSPDRLDLSAENARIARTAGVMIAITTDAHSTREFGLVRYGVDQARRAGYGESQVLNCQPWQELVRLFNR